MLEPEEFVPSAPSEAGGQVNVFHCKEGNNNDRLYIRRCDDGITILAYCHHCGERGWFRETGGRSLATLKASKNRTRSNGQEHAGYRKELRLPSDGTGKIEEWPARARLWIRQAGVTDSEVIQHRIVYSEEYGRVILPVYRDGDLALFQSRRIDPSDEKPKYLTYTKRKVGFWAKPLYQWHERADVVVIVEDILSSIRVARYYDSLALLGTDIADVDFLRILENYRKVLIFMDNDNRQVKMKQLKLKERCGTLLPTKVIKQDQDPKEFQDDALRELLDKEAK